MRFGFAGSSSGAFNVIDQSYDDGSQELNAEKKWPDVDFLGPSRLERPGFAMMRLRKRRIGLKFGDQNIVGMRLLPRQVNVKGKQGNQTNNRHVIRRRTNLPQLSPVHKISVWRGRPARECPSQFRSEPTRVVSKAGAGARPTKLLSRRLRAPARLVRFSFEHYRSRT